MRSQNQILYKFLFVQINAPTKLLSSAPEDSSEQEKCISSRLQKCPCNSIWKSFTGGVFDEKPLSLVSSLNTFANRISNWFLSVFCIQVNLVMYGGKERKFERFRKQGHFRI